MIERRDFTGAMNADDAEEFIGKNHYLQAMNMRVGRDADGRGGAAKPFKGTQQRTNDPLVGTEETMGSITDEVKGRVYYFKHNSNNNHRIWAWDRKTNQAFIVLQESNVTGGLDFSLDYPVTGLALIGDYLYWTDNLNQPRRIDVERGIKTNNPAYISQDGTTPDPYTLPLQQWDITVARRVPIYPLKWEKLISSDEDDIEDRPYNFLDRNGIQFSVRFGYYDSQFSTLGCYSKIAPHNSDGRFIRYVYQYDVLRISMDKAEEIEPEVRIVEFLARRDNIGPWYVIKTFDREKDSTVFDDHNTIGEPALSHSFYNEDYVGVPMSDSESYVPFFDVPLYSNALEIADNRLFFGNNVKGYDYVKGIEIAVEKKDYTWSLGDAWTLFADYYLIEWSCGTGISEMVVLRIGEWFGPACGWYDTNFTSADFNSNSLPLSVTIDPLSKIHIVDNNATPTELINFLNPTCLTYTFTEYPLNPAINGLSLGTVIENGIAFRKGKEYKVGIVFYDFAGRTPGVVHDPTTVIIPRPARIEDTYTIGLDWEITSDPSLIPLWGHSYSIVRSRVTEPFVAHTDTLIRYANKEDDGSYTFENEDDPPVHNVDYSQNYEGIGFNISRLLNFRGIGYVFSEGDVLMVITPTDEVFYLKIIGTYLEWVITENFDIGTIGGGEYYFEIITPTTESDELWEVGKNYEVLNPGASNRAFSVSSGTLAGDTFFALHNPRPEARPIPAMNANNKFWQIWPQDYGRPWKVLIAKQHRYETEVAWGATYFPGTETNNLNQFLSADIRTIDSALGAIQKLVFTSRTQEYGTVMLAIGQSDVASMYLGRTEFYNTDEVATVLRTVDVIGNINILKGGFGTLNPESVVENDGDVYWFSAIKSAFVRYSKAGVEPISERKMASFAQWLGNAILTTAADAPGVVPIRLPAGFDDFNREYVCSIPPIGTWPINYRVMDVETNMNATEAPVGSVTASLQAGEIYRFTFTAAGPVTVNITCNDLFFGSKTFTTVGSNVSFVFVSAFTTTYTFLVTTTPALPTVVHSYTLKKLHVDPYETVNLFPKTIVWSEESNGWSTFFNALPEWWGRVGDRLLSFKGGNLFTHDSSTPSSYYGVQWPSWIATIFNAMPNETKMLQVFSCEAEGGGGNDFNGAPDYVHFRTEQPYAQSSDVVRGEFDVVEGVPHVGIRKDRLSPNTPGTAIDKLLKGDDMRGRYAKVLIEYGKVRNFVLRLANLVTQASSGHKT